MLSDLNLAALQVKFKGFILYVHGINPECQLPIFYTNLKDHVSRMLHVQYLS